MRVVFVWFWAQHYYMIQRFLQQLDVMCVGSRKNYNRDFGIERAVQEGAFVTTCETALFELVKGAGSPHFKAISKLIK